ncbi:hypothetical protein [Vibrio mangrovi]|uniref:Uncharacterized protein n=1 Tax=Vibrio mangrovi TaxID=474394 RepID=A0A1Y6IVK5_9VIBR|nr:hypothetical protein [Vibrio mangrovi]MDW6001890.1 hypothetical protein [Vibrio mangrovi]SMS00083.1 hypothetical protein VIM7927_01324 [Vibrio mangrovi]
MNAQQLLRFFADHYDFERASQYLADPEVRFFAKSWLVVELGQLLIQHYPDAQHEFAPRYLLDEQYLHYREKDDRVEACNKRTASYADFSIRQASSPLWCEIFSIHQEQFRQRRERQKMAMNMARVDAFQHYLKREKVCLISALWGTFGTQDSALLAEFDNESQCTYALDSARQGSGQISRLCQIDKKAGPRLILTVYMPK